MKTTTTEKYHTNCPNCGGVIGPSDKFCTYCGTRVVYERTVTHESEEGTEMPLPKVNISNKVGATIACAIGIFFLVDWVIIAFGIMMTVGVGMGGMAGMGGFGGFDYGFGMLGFAAIIPFLFGCAGIVGIVFLIKKIIKINRTEGDK